MLEEQFGPVNNYRLCTTTGEDVIWFYAMTLYAFRYALVRERFSWRYSLACNLAAVFIYIARVLRPRAESLLERCLLGIIREYAQLTINDLSTT